jgi:hypothetical protein
MVLIPRFFLLSAKGYELFNADQAVVGLMAKHILEGKFMVYVYGQGYMGSLESCLASLIYRAGGMNILSLQMAPLVFFLLFLSAIFFFLREVFDLKTGFIASSLVALSPPLLNAISVTALGGYPETLFFGTLTLWGLMRASKLGSKGTLFLTGIAAGLGFWTNNLILMFFFSAGWFALLGSTFWKENRPRLSLKKILLLEDKRIPRWLKIAGWVVHLWVLAYVARELVFFILGPLDGPLAGLQEFVGAKPLHVKKLKKILVCVAVELGIVSWIVSGSRQILGKVKTVLPLAWGFALGASPAIAYPFFGGGDYRVIHSSGMIFLRELPAQIREVIGRGVIKNIFCVPTEYLFKGLSLETFQAWGMLILALGLIVFAGLSLRKARKKPPPALFPFLLAAVTLGICILSTLKADRYLLPLYFAVPLLFALALVRMASKWKVAAWLVWAALLVNQADANVRWAETLPDRSRIEEGEKAVLRFLEERGLRGAYANYWVSYPLTFRSGEKIIVAPYRSPDRYPEYTRFVDSLDRAAYIFSEEDSPYAPFQKALDDHQVPYEKVFLGPFTVFVMDRTVKSEKGFV